MREKPTRLKIPRLKRWLISVHEDLIQIHEHVPSTVYPRELSTFEKMVLALEDRRFFRHAGSDHLALLREIFRYWTFQRYGGASTIDMQFVRTVTNKRKRTAARKIYEIFLARIIQYRYSKAKILRGYLKCAFFGSKLTGSDSAALRLYGKYSDDLDVEESAHIAAMLVYPMPLKPGAKWQRNVKRRANYGKSVYIRLKKKFDKLKIAEPDYI